MIPMEKGPTLSAVPLGALIFLKFQVLKSHLKSWQ